jgi:lipopolysaccharide export LptBFGC system permease protein LptF
MHSPNCDPPRWHLIPAEPGSDANVSRWNIVIISILASLVISVLVVAIVLGIEARASTHAKIVIQTNASAEPPLASSCVPHFQPQGSAS